RCRRGPISRRPKEGLHAPPSRQAGWNGCPTGRRFSWAGRSIPTLLVPSAERPPRGLSRMTRIAGGRWALLGDPHQGVAPELRRVQQDHVRRSASQLGGGARATPELLVAGRERPLPGDQAPPIDEQWQRELGEDRQGRYRSRGDQPRAFPVAGVAAD